MNITKTLLAFLALAALLIAGSCGSEKITLEILPSDSEVAKAAKEKFKLLCSTCHGPTGMGDGAAAPADPKPRSFHDKDWQASVDDRHIYNAIIGGGAAVGMSPLMPGNPDLRSKREVVNYLVKIVRSFGQS